MIHFSPLDRYMHVLKSQATELNQSIEFRLIFFRFEVSHIGAFV